MAYITGVCNSWTDVKDTIISILTNNGWTSTTDSAGDTVVYSGNMYVRIKTDGTNVRFLGRTGIDTGDAPNEVWMTDFNASYIGPATFPALYHAFIFTDEFFFVLNYENKYQYFACGISNISLPGTGMWISATAGQNVPYRISLGDSWSKMYKLGEINGNYTSAAMFWTYNYSYTYARNSWVHNNIDPNYPWALGTTNTASSTGDIVGIQYLTERLMSQPNEFNKEALLLPIMAFKRSVTYTDKRHHILTVQNARHIRINYLEPGDIINNGLEEWMVFPWFKKQVGFPIYLYNMNHTATFGWAIRKA